MLEKNAEEIERLQSSILSLSDKEIFEFCPLPSIESTLCLLRGTIQEAMDNRQLAIESYTKALKLNIFCVEVCLCSLICNT